MCGNLEQLLADHDKHRMVGISPQQVKFLRLSNDCLLYSLYIYRLFVVLSWYYHGLSVEILSESSNRNYSTTFSSFGDQSFYSKCWRHCTCRCRPIGLRLRWCLQRGLPYCQMSVSPCETKGGPKIQGFIILFHFLAISEVSAFPDLEAKINHGKALDFGGEPGDSTFVCLIP